MKLSKNIRFLFIFLFISFSGYAQFFEKLGLGLRVTGAVLCMEKDTVGNRMFVAGDFENIENQEAKTIAYRDSAGWHAMADTFDYYVRDMKYVDGRLYVGGNIDKIDGVSMNNICYFDSTGWHPMDLGFDGTVSSIAYFDSTLYVSGYFTTTGSGIQVNGIAKWDGSSWIAVGSGADYPWVNLKVLDGSLYAFGYFDTFNGIASRNIIKYDGTSWIPCAVDTSHEVRNMTTCNGVLWATLFNTITHKSQLAKWVGTNWSFTGPTYSMDYIFCPLTTFNNKMYVFGWPSTTGLNSMSVSICDCNGYQIDTNDSINSLQTYGYWYFAKVIQDTLFFGGEFRKINNQIAAGVAAMHDTTLYSPFNATSGYYNSWQSAIGYGIYYDSTWNKLLVGGMFDFAGDKPANSVAAWDGVNWEPLGSGTNSMETSYVRSFIRYNGQLFMGGFFNESGNKQTGGLAVWNGTDWDSAGALVTTGIRDMVEFKGKLYVAGSISHMVGANNAEGIARYDGVSWSKVPKLTVTSSFVGSLCVFNNSLYASGEFDFSGNEYYLARLTNGNNWDSLDIPGGQIAYQMKVVNNKLYFATREAIYSYDGIVWDTIIVSTSNWPAGFRLGSIGNNLVFANLDQNRTFILNDQDSIQLLMQYEMFNSSSIDSSNSYLTGFIPYAFYRVDPMNHIIKIERKLPTASFTYTPDSICDHQYVHFGFDTLSHYSLSYRWYFPGGLPSMSSIATNDIKYSSPGLYDVGLKVSNGFGSDSVYFPGLIYVGNCSTGEPEVQYSKLKIYPNPVSGLLNIETGKTLNDKFILIVTDLMGHEVIKEENVSTTVHDNIPLDVSWLPSGIYTIKIYSPKYMCYNTFVKL